MDRSVRLWRLFRKEQSDPHAFYSGLAKDSVQQVAAFSSLSGAVVLDVGGGPGYFANAFEEAGAHYVALDADASEMRLHGRMPGPNTVQGSGVALPFRSGIVDLCYSSNVLEHVSEPWAMADEMVRVTRPGGLVMISYTLWYGPWGGHETAPWHYVGGKWAADRYRRRHGVPPKNEFGSTLFKVTAAAGLGWAHQAPGAEVVAAVPRYLPRWAGLFLAVPGLREVLVWNLLLVLRVAG